MSLAARRLPLLISTSFVASLALRLWLVFDALPEVMASHFDAAGQPNGFQDKQSFAAVSLALSAGNLMLFGALPWLLRKLPVSLINLPHREFWLAPGRRQGALARLDVYMDWFACATTALLAAVFELVLRANLARAPLASAATWLLLTSYLVFTLVWLVSLWRAFRLPHDAH
jgi:uncharacterized membrane protein